MARRRARLNVFGPAAGEEERAEHGEGDEKRPDDPLNEGSEQEEEHPDRRRDDDGGAPQGGAHHGLGVVNDELERGGGEEELGR